MSKLQCDICGGSIVMQGGGQLAVCDSCGTQYSVERMREKVQEITGTVRVEGSVQSRQTGTNDDMYAIFGIEGQYSKEGLAPWFIEKSQRYWQEQEEQRRQARREKGVCQYCGGSFSGLFVECGKSKDY